MADQKISQLTGSTTPLAGTEVLPVVQSGVTKQVSVANLTAGRDTAAKSIALTGVAATGYLSMTAGGTTTNYNFGQITNTGGGLYWGVDNNAGTGFSGNTAYGSVVSTSTATDLSFGTNNAIKWRIDNATGNLVAVTSGAGIDFSATPGTGTSELLNDYEEGAWTPTGSGITLAAAEGRYVKIGQQVTCWFFIQFPVTANTGNAVITGLPFTVRSGSNVGRGGGAFGFRSDAGLANLTLISNDGVTDLQFRLTSGGTGSDSTRPSNAQLSTLIFIGSIAYIASA